MIGGNKELQIKNQIFNYTINLPKVERKLELIENFKELNISDIALEKKKLFLFLSKVKMSTNQCCQLSHPFKTVEGQGRTRVFRQWTEQMTLTLS